MAQLVEQLTLNQRVPGSSPGGRTTKLPGTGETIGGVVAEVAELADALDSKSSLAYPR